MFAGGKIQGPLTTGLIQYNVEIILIMGEKEVI
jgi:hypothetical protein